MKFESYEISSAQKRIYLVDQFQESSVMYNIPTAKIIEGDLSRHRLETAIQKLIQRHEILRTSFSMKDGEIVQNVYETIDFNLKYTLLAPLEIDEIIEQFVQPFDLGSIPLWRAGLFGLDKGRHLFLFDIHHIIADGMSIDLIFNEMMVFYQGNDLPPLDFQYVDFTIWQNDLLESSEMENQETYWLEQFHGEIPVLQLSTDYPRTPQVDPAADIIKFEIGIALKQRLNQMAINHNTTLFIVLLAAYNILLSKYTGQEDIVIGTPIAGRRHPKLEMVVGMFVNTLPLRNRVVSSQTLAKFLQDMSQRTFLAFENQDYPFERLVEKLNVERQLNRNPLFDTVFALQNFAKDSRELVRTLETLRIIPYTLDNKLEKFDSSLLTVEEKGKIFFKFRYRTALFKREGIKTFLARFIRILRKMTGGTDLRIGEIEIISTKEKEFLLNSINNTGTDYPADKTLQQLFVEQAEQTPNHIALLGQSAGRRAQSAKRKEERHALGAGRCAITYRKLDEISNQLAYMFKKRGVEPDTIVAIMMERSVEMIIGILGILKAGGAYLPIDPDYPGKRIHYMLADSQTEFLLSEPETQVKVKAEVKGETGQPPGLPLQFFNIETAIESNLDPSHSTLTSTCQVSPTNLAYVIYTSGTTGKPKGVCVKHSAVVNLAHSQKNQLGINESDRILQFSNICFDASVEQIFIALFSGAVLVLIDKNTLLDVSQFEVFIFMHGITHLNAVPSFLSNMRLNRASTSRLKRVISGGDVCPASLVKKWSSYCDFYNGYGPTETTVTSILMRFEYIDEALARLPIGQPIHNTTVYLLDRWQNLVPLGVVGELYIGGDGVARGYLNRPELTARKFLPAFHMSYMSHMSYIYKTGDLARWLADRNIEFLGRIDHQVKIRGFRIELGEIECRLTAHDEIKEAVVLARVDKNGEKYLCAYIVVINEYNKFSVSQLREYLSRELPGYMIPSYFVKLEKIPLTSSGKTDRRALPEPELPVGLNAYIPPRDEIEEKLVGIWSEVLGIEKEKIGIDDNFFHLGGHSLKATILTSKIHKELRVKVPLAETFKTPTIRGLSEYIQLSAKNEYAVIQPVEKKEYYALSYAQKRLYILRQMEAENISYNLPVVLILEGELNREKIKEVFIQLISRHESFRTSFHLMDELPVQVVHDVVEFEIEYYDMKQVEVKVEEELSARSEGTRGLAPLPIEPAAVLIRSFIRPFDLSCAPLLRVGLTKLPHTPAALRGHPSQEGNKSKHILMVDMHHIITDGTSQEIFTQEFMTLYENKREELPPLRLQYKDIAQWQLSDTQRETIKKQEDYWKQQFAGEIPVLELPTDYSRPAVQSFAGGTIVFEIKEKEAAGLNQLAFAQGTSLYMVLLALYTIFLAKITGQEDIVVGTPLAGRRHTDSHQIIGMFVNTLGIRNYPDGEKIFSGFLQEVKEITLAAFENQDYPFEDLVEKVEVNRDTGRNPLFDVMFTLQNIERTEIVIPGLKLTPYDYEKRTSKFDLTLQTVETENSLRFDFEYSNKLFRAETIERFTQYFRKIISSVIKDTGQKICEIDIIPGPEKQLLLYEFNDTAAQYPKEKTLHQLYEKQVERTPDNIAVLGAMQSAERKAQSIERNKERHAPCAMHCALTYRKLNQKSNQLAHLLKERGIESDSIVGIMVDRSLEMIIGIMGILKAGGAYMPIDPDYPQERISYMLADSSAKFLVTTTGLSEKSEKLSIVNCQLLMVNEKFPESRRLNTPPKEANSINNYQLTIYNLQLKPTNLTYIIYTSGSTGRPKGVMIEHGSVVNILHALDKKYPFSETDTYLLKTTFVFDVSITELFGWFLGGGRLTVLEKNGEKDPQMILDVIARAGVTHINFVPSMFRALLEILDTQNIIKLSRLKYIFLAGEALSPVLVKKFNQFKLDILLENIYGPTESTIYASNFSLSGWEEKDHINIPIGKPLPNIRLYILDKYDRLQPAGVPGELCIGGAGLSRGYLNKPELTAEKFCLRRPGALFEKTAPGPRKNFSLLEGTRGLAPMLNKVPGQRIYMSSRSHMSYIYHTGDLARWLFYGNIEFIGRLDYQLKIRGFRVELGEIESQILTHEAIKETVVTTMETTDDKRLCAYIVTGDGDDFNREFHSEELRNYLSHILPNYMIPSFFVKLDKMPLNPNGKINRKALPMPEFRDTTQTYTGPRDENERKLVEIWSGVLGIEKEKIGIDDNFFHLGGHSLKATIVMSKIHKELKVKLPLAELFKSPSIRHLSQHIRGEETMDYLSIKPVEKKEYYALSSAQKRLYFLHQVDPRSTVYNIPMVLKLEGNADKNRIEKTAGELISRHENLRTAIELRREGTIQRVHEQVEFRVENYDIEVTEPGDTEVGDRRRREEIPNKKETGWRHSSNRNHRIIHDCFIRPFDLSRAPLLRMGLIKQEEKKYIMMVDMAHIISDGMSLAILIKDFIALYAGENLPPLRFHYKDYTEWQQSEEVKRLLRHQEQYWLNVFEGELPLLNLPLDNARSTLQDFEGRAVGFELSAGQTKALNETARGKGVTLFMMITAVYNIFLSKLSLQEDIVVGVPTAGRRHPDMHQIDGMFVNTLALRNYPTSNKTFAKFLEEVKTRTLSSFENQDYPFEDLVEKLVKDRDSGRNPLFDVVFLYQNIDIQGREISGLAVEPYKIEQKTSQFDLKLIGSEPEEKLSFKFEYRTKLFKEETIKQFISYIKNIISTVLENPGIMIGEIEIISEAEKNRLLYDINDTTAGYPKDKLIHELFERQAAGTPDRLAVAGTDRKGLLSLSYRELNKQANRLAQRLRAKDITAESVVGVMAYRSLEAVIALLAVLKADGAFLPIDPDYPESRKRFMIKDSGMKILLMQEQMAQKNTSLIPLLESGNILPLTGNTIYPEKTTNPGISNTPGNIAYIIYTSGSTGNPKGVMVEHRNVVNYISWGIKSYVRENNVNFPLFTSLSFDLTVTSIFTPLLSGNGIVLYEGDDKASLIEKVIEENRVGVVKLTPSHLKLILEQKSNLLSSPSTGEKIVTHIKRFIVGGEDLQTKIAEEITGAFSQPPEIYNEYGPTEATVGCMIYKFSPGNDTRQSVPIGVPADNVRIYLLDKNKKPVPVNVAAELYISGDGVARGYLNRPELTDERFKRAVISHSSLVFRSSKRLSKSTNDQCPMTNDRFYKTGDLARRLPDGNFEFLGRIDHQVKIRGFRVELGEIRGKLLEYNRHTPLKLLNAAEDPKILSLKKIRRCVKCLLPNNYPGIHFDNDGVCNVCLEFEKYEKDALTYFKEREDFHRLVEETLKTERGQYDCLLLFSGGKDSSYVLYQLMDMGLKVLTLTFDNGYISDAAFKNIKRITSELGVENIVCKAKNMNKVFVESLNTNRNVCHGCWNALNTMGVKAAHEKGINLVISGLSRGQIVEMRLEGLFQRGIFDEKEVEENLLLFRKAFHSKSNKFSRILNVELAEGVIEQIHFVDFFRYFDTPVSEIEKYLSEKGWTRPGDTGFCSSNCIINDVGIYMHIKEEGYHFYANQLSWDCRLGSITREQGFKEIGFAGDLQQVDNILNQIGYYDSPIKNAVIMDKENDRGDKHLVAYMVAEEELTVQELREYLAKELPDYMVPSSFVQLDKIPLTPNGKVNRKALEVSGKRLARGTVYVPPRNEAEIKMVNIWKEVLQLDKVGIHDNYFDLGGTSFEIIRINSKLKEIFQVDIPVVTMFRYTTVRSLTQYLSNIKTDIRDRSTSLKRGKGEKRQQLQKRRGARNGR